MSNLSFVARNGLSVGTVATPVIDASANITGVSLTLSTPLPAASGGLGAPIIGIVIGNGSAYSAGIAGTDYSAPAAPTSTTTRYVAKQLFAAASASVSGSLNIPVGSNNTAISGDLYGTATGITWHNGTSVKTLAYADGSNISGTISISIGGNAATSTNATNLSGGTIGQIPYQTGPNYTNFLSAGTAGYIFTSTGASAPTWVNPTSLTVGYANNISGIVPIVNGGTGTSSASQVLSNIMPVGEVASYVLTTGGVGNFYWAAQTGTSLLSGSTINIQKSSYIATGGQTVFTTPTYVPGSGQLKVWVNGLRRFDSSYVETNSTTVTLNNPGVNLNDSVIVEVDGYILYTPTAAGTIFTPSGSISATDVNGALVSLDTSKAPLASPILTGNPTTPNQTPLNVNTTRIANVGYVDAAAALRAPLGGVGTSGIWPISITGNAVTLTNFTSLSDRPNLDYNLAGRTNGIYSIYAAGVNGPGSIYLNLIHCANGSDVGFQIAGGYLSDSMYFRGTSGLNTGTGWTPWRTVIHSGTIAAQSVNYAASAGLATPRLTNGVGAQFNWSGLAGQPAWLIGGSDGTNFYVYNPSNFNVNYANSAGYAASAGSVPAPGYGAVGSYVTGTASGVNVPGYAVGTLVSGASLNYSTNTINGSLTSMGLTGTWECHGSSGTGSVPGVGLYVIQLWLRKS